MRVVIATILLLYSQVALASSAQELGKELGRQGHFG
jgi:hypothetical protein